MVDTIRDRAALLALLADNSVGAISPQDMRDVVVSIFGVYGSIYCVDASTAQGGIGTTYAKVLGFTDNGPASVGCSPNATADEITIDVSGDYLFLFQCSWEGSNNTEFTFAMHVDGTATAGRSVRKIGTSSDVGSTFFAGGAPIAAGQAVDVRIKADGTGKSITPIHMGLGILKIG